MEWQWLALLDKQGIFSTLPAEFSPVMIASDVKSGAGWLRILGPEASERNNLAIALCTSSFEKTHCHFTVALLRVLRYTLSGLNFWR